MMELKKYIYIIKKKKNNQIDTQKVLPYPSLRGKKFTEESKNNFNCNFNERKKKKNRK